ncbi:MAG: hypothetical protein MJ116_02130 [Lachnospiraceae bacterium]|nr:hypothetical protein [Lachnospiraceae bacterium]
MKIDDSILEQTALVQEAMEILRKDSWKKRGVKSESISKRKYFSNSENELVRIGRLLSRKKKSRGSSVEKNRRQNLEKKSASHSFGGTQN